MCSFVTHMLNKGSSSQLKQKRLGNRNSKTLEIPSHNDKKSLANIESPFNPIIANQNIDIKYLKIKLSENIF